MLYEFAQRPQRSLIAQPNPDVKGSGYQSLHDIKVSGYKSLHDNFFAFYFANLYIFQQLLYCKFHNE